MVNAYKVEEEETTVEEEEERDTSSTITGSIPPPEQGLKIWLLPSAPVLLAPRTARPPYCSPVLLVHTARPYCSHCGPRRQLLL